MDRTVSKKQRGILGTLVVLLAISVFNIQAWADSRADLTILSTVVGHYMGPNPTNEVPIHANWEMLTKLMKEVNIFDRVVERIEASVCNPAKNKSVLLVGDPSETYQFIFARFAARKAAASCPNLDHVEIDLNKLIAGNGMPGEIEEYWQTKVLKSAEYKDVVLYVSNLARLLGLGAQGSAQSGIEAEYASNISSGQLKSVAFISKYEYNQLVFGSHSYVLNSFSNIIRLDEVTENEVFTLLQSYLKTLYPRLSLNKTEAKYLAQTIAHYWPNVEEPQRSLTVLKDLIRKLGTGVAQTLYPSTIETPHPYNPNSNQDWVVDYPREHQLQLSFEIFATENKFDQLQVIDAYSGKVLEVISGNIGAFKTQVYPTNKLNLKFISDNSTQRYGFKVKEVIGLKMGEDQHAFTVEEIRRSIMELSQVPLWLMERNFSVIKNLEAQLEAEVVGVGEAKKQIMNQARIGYVAGRTDEKPIGTLLLAGPTGTGKSFVAKKLAEFLQLELITLDMTAFRTEESLDRFLEVMSANLVTRPYAIYLFEEIDKADLKVLDRLYFLMDEGIFYDKYQRPLFARGAFVLMTTNAGQDVILQNPTHPNLRQLVYNELMKVFRPSFLNRFDGISLFKPFTAEEFGKLAKILTKKKIQRLNEFYQWTLTVDEATLAYLSLKGQSQLFGARPMERLVEHLISFGISEYQFKVGNIPTRSILAITKAQAEHSFNISMQGRAEVVNFIVDPEINSGKILKGLKSNP